MKALIVDDTVVFRKILSEAMSTFPGVEVIGTAPGGALALKKLAQTPADLVLLDVHMEGMDGIETLEHLRRDFPDTAVVMVSGINTRSTESTIRALEMGALDFIRKPDGSDYQQNIAALRQDLLNVVRGLETRRLTRTVKSAAPAAQTKIVQTPIPKQAASPSLRPTGPRRQPEAVAVVAIGVSTGGPEALTRLIPRLPRDLGVPVVLVQHMPPVFTKSLAESLAKKSALKVVEADDNQEIKAGTVYIAPGGRHMTIKESEGCVRAVMNTDPPENSCRPSVDVLFRSVAAVYGGKGVLSVILTGMGSDGMEGVKKLKAGKCFSLTQSESSCVVYGMPRAVDEAFLSDESVDIEKMAGRIAEITAACRIRG